MKIAGDEIGRESLGQGRLADAKVEAAHAVADVKEDAVGPCLPHLGKKAPVLRQNPFALTREAVGDDVPRPQEGKHLRERLRRVADMDHH